MGHKVLTLGTRDSNERHLVLLASLLNGSFQLMPPGIGYDAVLACINGPHIVEVKSSYKAKFTPKEQVTKIEIEATGCRYNIIVTCQELIILMGVILEELPLSRLLFISSEMIKYSSQPDVEILLDKITSIIVKQNEGLFE